MVVVSFLLEVDHIGFVMIVVLDDESVLAHLLGMYPLDVDSFPFSFELRNAIRYCKIYGMSSIKTY